MASPGDKFYDNIRGAERDAFKALEALFKSYGLESLVDNIQQYALQGYSTQMVQILLPETKEYKERFKANEARVKNNLRVLTPVEYIETEKAYERMMFNAGLPAGFYDSRDDYTKFLENDASPVELEERINAARAAVTSDNPLIRETYRQWYAAGLSEGDAIAAVLDPLKGGGLAEKKRRAAAAALGGAASYQGVGIDRERAEALANMGVSGQNALQGFGQVADIQRNAGTLASRYGMDYEGQTDAENAVFANDANAIQRIRKLGQREAAEFGGRGVGDSRSLGRGSY